MVDCSFGDFPARGYLWQTNMFRGLRAHDIAKTYRSCCSEDGYALIGVAPGQAQEAIQ